MVRMPSACDCDVDIVFGDEVDAGRNVCFFRNIHDIILGK